MLEVVMVMTITVRAMVRVRVMNGIVVVDGKSRSNGN